ncbi:Aste57867_10888 [Aphanomyces stellatus]|uniref:Aste57867_10888 protein n=1 Tax=Aphanomyces stellatus TaxID=120398 RepID=A0A485KS20_9STRA|nr:hypothetical protein As57867_010848 [Aphanomyces stellatus]VFT87756.1 Aste57867_10888 [Aphanomyces stellatus]
MTIQRCFLAAACAAGLSTANHASLHHEANAHGSVWEPIASSLVTTPAPPPTTAAQGLTTDEKIAHAIAFVKTQMKVNPMPGVGLSVVYENKPVIAQGFGTNAVGDEKNPVTSSSVFPIGAYSDTFIAVGLAKLVDDGKLWWDDSIKKHLPWFELSDKYAEKYLTLGDVASMNVGVTEYFAPEWIFDELLSERDLISILRDMPTRTSLRPGFEKSMLASQLLSQVIEAVTNQTWHAYLKTSVWEPLGMHDTAGRAGDIDKQLAMGHYSCHGSVIGPFHQLKDSMVAFRPRRDYMASWSIVSSVADLTRFSEFLLDPKHKNLVHMPYLVDELFTGHLNRRINSATADGYKVKYGYSMASHGGAFASGYGFTLIGNIMWGHEYFEQKMVDDGFGFRLVNGFVYSRGLGLTITTNANVNNGNMSDSFRLDWMRSYILGLFLDVPIATLDGLFTQSMAALDQKSFPAPCDAHYFEGKPWDIPGVIIPDDTKHQLVGTYHAAGLANTTMRATVSIQGKDLMLQFGAYTRRLIATERPQTYVWALDWDLQSFSVVVTKPASHDNTSLSVLLNGNQLVKFTRD